MLVDLRGRPLAAPRPSSAAFGGAVANPIPREDFIHEQEPPAAWVERLAQVSPPDHPHISWLEIGWVAGTLEAAIQRWVLYEVTPPAHVPKAAKEAFHHMHNHERREDHTAEEQRMLRAFFERGVWLRPFWIIQGEQGGHRYRFLQSEQRELELMGLPTEPPLPGDLPFAPFDERVVRQIMQWDVLRKGYADIRSGQATERARLAQEWRTTFLDWLQRQLTLENVYNDVSLDDAGDHIPRVAREAMPEERLAEIEQTYIETGRLLPARRRNV